MQEEITIYEMNKLLIKKRLEEIYSSSPKEKHPPKLTVASKRRVKPLKVKLPTKKTK